MKKTRAQSLFDSFGNTMSGFGIGLFCQWLFLPLLGVAIAFDQNLIFAGIMTGVSWGRGYAWSRFMEWLHIRTPLSPAMLALVAERSRQQEIEGYVAAHDDALAPGTLALLGACYGLANVGALAVNDPRRPAEDAPIELEARDLWPLDPEEFRPRDRRRNLVRGAALYVAELEKLERARKALARRPLFPKHKLAVAGGDN